MHRLKNKTVYLSGSISADPDYREKFRKAAEKVLAAGAKRCLNPAIFPDGWEYHEYMEHAFVMLRRSEVIAMLPCWISSPGAIAEKAYAESIKMPVIQLWG